MSNQHDAIGRIGGVQVFSSGHKQRIQMRMANACGMKQESMSAMRGKNRYGWRKIAARQYGRQK
jgi:hypothetical protein